MLKIGYLLIIIVIITILFIIYKLYEIYNKNNAPNKNNKNSHLSLANSEITRKKTIPKIIIQTWKSDLIPQRYMELIDSIKEQNPDYEYLFFTDESIAQFLNMHYPEYYQTYLKLPVKIQRIDFFRYIAVYHYGGFYMDLDVNGLKPFDDLLDYECIFPIDEYIKKRMCTAKRYKPFCDKGYYYLLGQYAFAAAPKHPFIKSLIDDIHANINKHIRNVNLKSEDYVYKSTGPDFVTDMYIKYENQNEVFILNNGKRQRFGDYAKHNYFGTWKSTDEY